jgi:hypothetical protein
MNNKQKLVETIERISIQSRLSEGFLSKLFLSSLKKWIKLDPNVARALTKAHGAAKELEDEIDKIRRDFPHLDIPDHILKYAGKK